jgi:GTP-binding protein Era
MPPERIAAAMQAAAELGPFAELHPVSAKTGDGVAALVADLVRLAPEGPALFPEEARSSDPVRLQISELIREQALRRLRDEVPHALTVVVEEYDPPTRRRAARIEASIYVDSKSQQGIVIGAGGTMIRDIGTSARPGIERIIGGKVIGDGSSEEPLMPVLFVEQGGKQYALIISSDDEMNDGGRIMIERGLHAFQHPTILDGAR